MAKCRVVVSCYEWIQYTCTWVFNITLVNYRDVFSQGNIRVFCRVRKPICPAEEESEIFTYPDLDKKKVTLALTNVMVKQIHSLVLLQSRHKLRRNCHNHIARRLFFMLDSGAVSFKNENLQ